MPVVTGTTVYENGSALAGAGVRSKAGALSPHKQSDTGDPAAPPIVAPLWREHVEEKL